MIDKRTLLFSPATYNLAEVTRCIEIAKACRGSFDVLFLSYGGDYEGEIETAGFSVRRLNPRLSPEKIEHLYKVDQGQKIGYFFNKKEAREQIENEIALINEVRPVAVVTGFNFTNNISCRATKTPLIWLTHTTWLFDALIEQGIFTYPDMLDLPILRLLGEKNLLRLTRVMLKIFNWTLKPYNRLAQEYGVDPFHSLEEAYRGDYNLLAEPEDFSGLKVPETFHFIPPLIGRLEKPVPQEILHLPRDQPIVYFAMGSSGQSKLIAQILEGFEGCPFRVIAPVKPHIKDLKVKVPNNVLVTDWLPAHKVNPMADISVIHGGIGTTMTALLAGKPIVGVAMQIEQEANIDCVVRKGFAIRIRKSSFTPQKLNAAIDSLLKDEEASRKAAAYQKIVQASLDSNKVMKFFEQTFPVKSDHE